MSPADDPWKEITEKIIGCAFDVSNELGCGFLEKVYENAMVIALKQAGLKVEQQVRYLITFRGSEVGEYIADLVVQDAILVELKAVAALADVHTAQCINFQCASRLPAGLLINFGKPKVEFKRFYERKKSS